MTDRQAGEYGLRECPKCHEHMSPDLNPAECLVCGWKEAGEYEREARELMDACVYRTGATIHDINLTEAAAWLRQRDQEHARQLADVLHTAYKYDDKPHHLYSAIRRLAEANPSQDTPEIIRLMDAAMEHPARYEKLIRAAEEAEAFLTQLSAQFNRCACGDKPIDYYYCRICQFFPKHTHEWNTPERVLHSPDCAFALWRAALRSALSDGENKEPNENRT